MGGGHWRGWYLYWLEAYLGGTCGHFESAFLNRRQWGKLSHPQMRAFFFSSLPCAVMFHLNLAILLWINAFSWGYVSCNLHSSTGQPSPLLLFLGFPTLLTLFLPLLHSPAPNWQVYHIYIALLYQHCSKHFLYINSFNIRNILWWMYPNFSDEGIEALKGDVICSKSQVNVQNMSVPEPILSDTLLVCLSARSPQ